MGSKNILLVEDDLPLLKLLAEQLRILGYIVEPCTSPGEALAKWWTEPTRYRLVMTDWSMFPKNGLELAKAMRILGCEAPILLNSARGEVFSRDELDKHGVTAFLQKPFDLDTLKQHIEAVMV